MRARAQQPEPESDSRSSFIEPAPPVQEPAPEPTPEPAAGPTLGQRLGTVGIVVLAVVAGAAAWLVTSFIKF
jgi:hypothetical protein